MKHIGRRNDTEVIINNKQYRLSGFERYQVHLEPEVQIVGGSI